MLFWPLLYETREIGGIHNTGKAASTMIEIKEH